MSRIDLPLARAASSDPGRALVRLPRDRMARLGLRPGDIVMLQAARKTHARVMPAADDATSLEVSADLASNTGADWGAEVSIAAADLPALRSAILKAKADDGASIPDLSEVLFDVPLTVGDRITVALPGGRNGIYEVAALDPDGAGLFCETTTLTIAARPGGTGGYEGIGGLTDQIARVHEMVAAPLLRPELFARLGVAPPRGVLFTGPPGSGKTLLARSVAARTSAAFFQIAGPEIVSKHYGDSEAALRKVFAAAAKDAPAIIFIDEIDAIAPKRDGLSGEKQVERRIVAQLLTLMDGLDDRGKVVVMAATNLPDTLDPALRRPGRFDREIPFDVPDPQQRGDILRIHLRPAPLAGDVDLDAIAAASHGYVGADLAGLAREAALAALDRSIGAAGSEDAVRAEDLSIQQADLLQGLAATAPSALRDSDPVGPPVEWDDIGGLEAEKRILTEAVIWPQRHRAAFAALDLSPARGVLLSGPPGSGKTLIARALAHESGMNFIPVRPTRIMSQYLGDAERTIADIFARARHAAPSLVFFDELDALTPPRGGKDAALDRIVAQMLIEIDGLLPASGIVVLAASNRAAGIDPALLRPGRFDLVLPVPLPDAQARQRILEVHCRMRPLAGDVDLAAVATATHGMSGAALAALVAAAARAALQRTLNAGTDPTETRITMTDLTTALAAHLQSDDARSADHIATKDGI